MEWILLLCAIVIEVTATTLFKFANGFQNLLAFGGGMLLFVLSLTIWSFSINKIDVGVAYSIWAGLGTALVVVIGYFWFGEPMNALKVMFIAFIVVGAIGLNLTSSAH
jgi:small multidrug resistance pump